MAAVLEKSGRGHWLACLTFFYRILRIVIPEDLLFLRIKSLATSGVRIGLWPRRGRADSLEDRGVWSEYTGLSLAGLLDGLKKDIMRLCVRGVLIQLYRVCSGLFVSVVIG